MPETAAATVRCAAAAAAIPWWGSLERNGPEGHHPAAVVAPGGRYASRASASHRYVSGADGAVAVWSAGLTSALGLEQKQVVQIEGGIEVAHLAANGGPALKWGVAVESTMGTLMDQIGDQAVAEQRHFAAQLLIGVVVVVGFPVHRSSSWCSRVC